METEDNENPIDLIDEYCKLNDEIGILNKRRKAVKAKFLKYREKFCPDEEKFHGTKHEILVREGSRLSYDMKAAMEDNGELFFIDYERHTPTLTLTVKKKR